MQMVLDGRYAHFHRNTSNKEKIKISLKGGHRADLVPKKRRGRPLSRSYREAIEKL
ncbi:hypothetical protein J6TS7_09730 [Paenibacillus dendritiformis]|nr:hypothetical protein J6TS7_09730 [Paenibacillus dendritiformis]